MLAEKLKDDLAGSVAAAELNPPEADVVAGAAPNKFPAPEPKVVVEVTHVMARRLTLPGVKAFT